MSWSDDDVRRVGLALRDAQDRLGPKATGGEIVFDVLKTVNEIDRRQTVSGHSVAPKKKVWWADLAYANRKPEEKEEDARQRLIDIAAGDDPRVVLGINFFVSPAEIATLESVRTVFRECLVGQKQSRDWRLISLLAVGKPFTRVAKIMHMSSWSVQDRKKLQCTAIWSRVKGMIPTKRSIVLRETVAVPRGQAA